MSTNVKHPKNKNIETSLDFFNSLCKNRRHLRKDVYIMTAAPKNFSFNLTLIDHAIVNALQEALEHIMPEIMSDNQS